MTTSKIREELLAKIIDRDIISIPALITRGMIIGGSEKYAYESELIGKIRRLLYMKKTVNPRQCWGETQEWKEWDEETED